MCQENIPLTVTPTFTSLHGWWAGWLYEFRPLVQSSDPTTRVSAEIQTSLQLFSLPLSSVDEPVPTAASAFMYLVWRLMSWINSMTLFCSPQVYSVVIGDTIVFTISSNQSQHSPGTVHLSGPFQYPELPISGWCFFLLCFYFCGWKIPDDQQL